MQFLAIVLLSGLSAISYGILHDGISGRICLEYFTVGQSEDFLPAYPAWFVLSHSIITTSWAGIAFGVALALAARQGSAPKLKAVFFVKPLTGLVFVVAIGAVFGGVVGWVAAIQKWHELTHELELHVPVGKREAYIVVWWANLMSYAGGLVGGGVLVYWTWRKRQAFARMVEEKRGA